MKIKKTLDVLGLFLDIALSDMQYISLKKHSFSSLYHEWISSFNSQSKKPKSQKYVNNIISII